MSLPIGSTSAVVERRIHKGLAENLAQFAYQQNTLEVPVDLSRIAESLGVVEILATTVD